MASSTMNPSQPGGCVLWTPWGPQSASESKTQFSSLRRTLRKLASPNTRNSGSDTALVKPECAYEP